MFEIPKIKINDLEIFYRLTGKGNETIVLVQGLGQKSSGWQLQVPYFRSKKMRVLVYDNIGVGKSSRPDYPYSMELYVDILKNLLDQLNITKKVHLCGISMGGMIAQHFALTYPDRLKTLILIATAAKCEVKPLIDMIESMADKSPEERMEGLLPALFSSSFIRTIKKDKNLYEMLKADFLTDETRVQDYVNQSKAIEKHNTIDQLGNINTPTLIIVGTRDMLLPLKPYSQLLHEKIPNSKLEIIKGAGHGCTIEAANQVNEIIYDFIKNYFD